VYPDPATPGVFEGDDPFAVGDSFGPGRPTDEPPGGLVAFWQVGKNTPGIHNDHRDGNTYLVLTEAVDPPPVSPGWFVAPAKLDPSFELDQRGSRAVFLVRVTNTVETDSGPVLDCEFQVDRR
jgi:hypothetical protein